jgi:AcrR family transcriptional regulator
MGDRVVEAARVTEAALRCVARWGVNKTSLDDVAREAGSSRATIYRQYPGGKDALFHAVLRSEISAFLDRIRSLINDADNLEDALVAAMTEAGRTPVAHEALSYLFEHEPGLVLPRLAFRELDGVLALIRREAGPALANHLDGDQDEAARVAEWVARITLSYTLSPATGVDTSDPDSVRELVRTYVLPGIAIALNQPAMN